MATPNFNNRLLLCGPCNQIKSNTLTLSGLGGRTRGGGWRSSDKPTRRLRENDAVMLE